MVSLPDFRDRLLFQQAMTHRSYANEHPEAGNHNERLEFLGDAVLNFLSGEFLYKRFPDRPEGELTRLRSVLVDEAQLTEFAELLGLDRHMRLGKGAEQGGGRQNPNLLSSTFEALIGAYFLDSQPDMAAVRQQVEPLFVAVIDRLAAAAPAANVKSRLQEWALAHGGEVPRYRIIDQVGPDHAREFTAEVYIGGQAYGTGRGRRKQDAEKAAAQQALQALNLPPLGAG